MVISRLPNSLFFMFTISIPLNFFIRWAAILNKLTKNGSQLKKRSVGLKYMLNPSKMFVGVNAQFGYMSVMETHLEFAGWRN